MPTPTLDEYDMASTYAEEFARAQVNSSVKDVTCIYRSHAFPASRLVWKIEKSGRPFALKIDTLSPETGRLSKEFDVLTRLSDHFKGNETNRVVRPVYLAPHGAFMVTEFIDRPTAVDYIYNSSNDDQVAQVYRRAGSWLNTLHSFQAPTEYAFRPRWMTDSINDLSTALPLHIEEASKPMIDAFLSQAKRLKNRPDIRVFSHGDFHGDNLIMGSGTVIGLDFTEARDKLAVYDIVDLLKADIFRDGPASEIDRSGVLRKNKDMFFRQYRHPIDPEILECCLRGRLLKDWLRLWQTDFTCSPFEDRKKHRLHLRLRAAFSTD
ncbi:aminoglycoside phosphotransferase family protein [Ruegeria profundi]|nr:aminoglycoside phosphotransferase family protein [Ruegeria profundi]